MRPPPATMSRLDHPGRSGFASLVSVDAPAAEPVMHRPYPGLFAGLVIGVVTAARGRPDCSHFPERTRRPAFRANGLSEGTGLWLRTARDRDA